MDCAVDSFASRFLNCGVDVFLNMLRHVSPPLVGVTDMKAGDMCFKRLNFGSNLRYTYGGS